MERVLAIALATIALPVISQPAQANPATVQAAIGACAANPGTCAVVGAAAGTWILWQNAPKVFCTYAHCTTQRMLTDPEAREESDSDYVWANDDQQARQMCERYAANNRARLDRVAEAGSWRNNWGKKKYVCYITRFLER